MKTLHLSIITGSGIAALVTLAVVLLMTHSASADGSLAIIMNKHEYGTEEPIQFFVQTRDQPEENAFPTAFIVNGQNQTVWYDDDLPPNGSKEGMNEYYVSENSWNVPMINQTGKYSLFVTYEGQKAYEALTVTELVSEDGMVHFYGPYQGLDNKSRTAQIANQTYYLMTVPGAPSDQTRPNDTTITFHGVSFTFPGCGKCLTAPMPFNPLQPVIVKFSDNTTETLAVRDNMWSTIGMQAYTHEYFPNGTRGTTWKQIQHRDQIVTTLTRHTEPQAGITVTRDSVKLLVSENPQNVESGAGLSFGGFGTPFQLSSPLKQFKSGIESKDVKCNSGFQLVFKTEDGSPACVKPDTAQKLIGRGWAIPPLAYHGPAWKSFGARMSTYGNITNVTAQPLIPPPATLPRATSHHFNYTAALYAKIPNWNQRFACYKYQGHAIQISADISNALKFSGLVTGPNGVVHDIPSAALNSTLMQIQFSASSSDPDGTYSVAFNVVNGSSTSNVNFYCADTEMTEPMMHPPLHATPP